jgi:sigma-B regulation protein RsbU (phosphoserine phosphatase)
MAGLRRAIAALVLLAFGMVLAVLGLAVFSAVRSNAAAVERSTRLEPATREAAVLLTEIVNERGAVAAYLLTSQSEELAPHYAARRSVPRRIDTLRELLSDFQAPDAALRRVEMAYLAWSTRVAQPQIDAMDAGDAARAREVEQAAGADVLFDELRARLVGLDVQISQAQEEAFERVQTSSRLLLSSLAAAVLVILLMTIVLVIGLRRWLLSPIDSLRRAVNAVAAGRYDTTIPAVGPKEIVALASNVEAMRALLVRLVRQNERSWEALAQQGPAVVALRDALTPSVLHSGGVVLRGRVDPAEGELAGDWFDSFDLPDGRVGVIVGDVSGHGAAAGVFALRLKQLLGAALSSGVAPGVAVEWAVERLGETDEMFATAIVAVVDPPTGTLQYANAGHPEPLLLRLGAEHTPAGHGGGPAGDGGPAVTVLRVTGPLVSSLLAQPGAWRSESVRLRPGDVFFAYTDGLVECRDGAGDQFGQKRLIDEILRDPRRPPAELLDDVFSAVRRHCPDRQGDDRTAIVLACTDETG